MALSWEPRWVRVKVKCGGIEVTTCKDLSTNLLLCPLCVDINKVCPEGKETNISVEDVPTFFTVEDLINHMKTHGSHRYSKKIKPVKGFERPEGS